MLIGTKTDLVQIWIALVLSKNLVSAQWRPYSIFNVHSNYFFEHCYRKNHSKTCISLFDFSKTILSFSIRLKMSDFIFYILCEMSDWPKKNEERKEWRKGELGKKERHRKKKRKKDHCIGVRERERERDCASIKWKGKRTHWRERERVRVLQICEWIPR